MSFLTSYLPSTSLSADTSINRLSVIPWALCSPLQRGRLLGEGQSEEPVGPGPGAGPAEDQGAVRHHPHEGGAHQGAGEDRYGAPQTSLTQRSMNLISCFVKGLSKCTLSTVSI